MPNEIECENCGHKFLPGEDDTCCPKCGYDSDDTIRVSEEFYECADR